MAGEGRNGTVVLPPGNRAPVVARMIVPTTTNIVLTLDAEDPTRARWLTPQGLDHYFSDPDGDTLDYSVRSSDPGVVEPRVAELIDDEKRVAVVGLRSGTATITVIARDSGGLTARQQFRVTVRQTTSRNRTPVIRTRFQDLTHTVSSLEDQRRTWTFNLASYFSDPDGDTLTYNATTTNVFIAAASATGNQLNVRSGVDGAATITVTATDPGGLTASQSFRLTTTFQRQSNRAPVVRSRINDDGLLTNANEPWTLTYRSPYPLDTYFSDPDGDPLTYSVSGNNPLFSMTVVPFEGGRVLFMLASGNGREGDQVATFRVTATDPSGATATQTFRLSLNFRATVPPPADRWGAISVGDLFPNCQNRAYGTASGYSSRDDAINQALSACRSRSSVGCSRSNVLAWRNGCGAFAEGRGCAWQGPPADPLGQRLNRPHSRDVAGERPDAGSGCTFARDEDRTRHVPRRPVRTVGPVAADAEPRHVRDDQQRRLERVYRDKPAWRQGRSKPLEVSHCSVARRMDGAPGYAVPFKPLEHPERASFPQVPLPHRVGEPCAVQDGPYAVVAHGHGAKQHDGPAGQTWKILREHPVCPLASEVAEQFPFEDGPSLALRGIEPHRGPSLDVAPGGVRHVQQGEALPGGVTEVPAHFGDGADEALGARGPDLSSRGTMPREVPAGSPPR